MTASPDLFRSILVPLDGSPLAEAALPLATSIAPAGDGTVRLVLVHQRPAAPLDPAAARQFVSADLAMRKSERAYLSSVQRRLRDEGTQVSSAVVLTGQPARALARHAREAAPDLVVMATHGRGGLGRAWLGSVADHLVRELSIPVLLVRPGESTAVGPSPRATRRILVPIDGSSLAETALEPAARLARCWDAELALHAVVHPVLLGSDPALPIPSAYDEKLTAAERAQMQDYLDDLVEQLRCQGLRATGAAAIGWSPVASILDAARPDRADAVVLATHGRGGLRRMMLGSVADKLVRSAEVPVLVHRPARHGAAEGRAPTRTRGRALAAAART